MAAPQPQARRFSYADYLRWPQGERWELIDGEACAMSPAPTRRHQAISREIGRQIANYLLGRDCEVYSAPFDVRLPDSPAADDDETWTVVQPDIAVICDRSRLDDRGCRGAPDWMIEILSPDSAQRDLRDKLALYERHGVREYWVVDPSHQVVEVFRQGEGSGYGKPVVFGPKDKALSSVLPELAIDLEPVFAA
jgi:Uma2 family endonuclease